MCLMYDVPPKDKVGECAMAIVRILMQYKDEPNKFRCLVEARVKDCLEIIDAANENSEAK